ncbi:MAG: hypothetical protein U1E83_00600 [Methylotetracoccus sp.]
MSTRIRRLAAAWLCIAWLVPLYASEPVTPGSTLVDGSLWTRSSPGERRAYLIGIGNMITVGDLYDQKKVPQQSGTLSRRLADIARVHPVTLEGAEQRITRWYEAHPDQLAKPVLAVIWLDMIKPNLPSGGR